MGFGCKLWCSSTGAEVCSTPRCGDWCALRFALRLNELTGFSASGIPRATLFLHSGLTMLVPYFHTRLRSHALSNAWPDAPSSDRRRKAWELLTRLESLHGMAALLNFVVFLWNGRYVSRRDCKVNPIVLTVTSRYRTLADRLLSLRLISARRHFQREVSYEFMNRQMVWHAFTVSSSF